MPQTPAQRLDLALDDRRIELGLTWGQVADRVGRSEEMIRRFRNTGTGSRETKAGLERALGWTKGSVDAVLKGGRPSLLTVNSAIAPVPEPVSRRDAALHHLDSGELNMIELTGLEHADVLTVMAGALDLLSKCVQALQGEGQGG